MRISARLKLVCLVLLLCLLVPSVASASERKIFFSGMGPFSTAPLGRFDNARQAGRNDSVNAMVIRLFDCTVAIPRTFWQRERLVVSPLRTTFGLPQDSVSPLRVFWTTEVRPQWAGMRISGWILCDAW